MTLFASILACFKRIEADFTYLLMAGNEYPAASPLHSWCDWERRGGESEQKIYHIQPARLLFQLPQKCLSFCCALKHWHLDFVKDGTSGEVLFEYHPHDLRGFIHNRIWSCFSFLHITDWPSYLVVQGVYVFQSLGGRRGWAKKERCRLFLFPQYILCVLGKASAARYSWTLSDVGYARTIQLRTGW